MPTHLKMFRPPFGHQNWASYLDARLLGYQVVTWQTLAEDWLDNDADWLTGKLLREIKPGHIVLLHDHLYNLLDSRYADRGATLNCVEKILQCLGKEFEFATVPRLLECGRVRRRIHIRKPDEAFLARLKRSDLGMTTSA
jgi:peptidoglycan/xylan/chitin deacetylase (PgdA/CDA1 family)